MSLIHLRPHHIFDVVPKSERSVTLCLPDRTSLTSLLERGILAALTLLLRPRRIFEFGTSRGEGTLILAENSQAEVFTLDLDADAVLDTDHRMDSFEMKNLQARAGKLLFSGTPADQRIRTILADSTRFDFRPYEGQMHLIVVDGGHDLRVVESDTKAAFRMISPHDPSCILWHDFGNPHYRITESLMRLSEEHVIFHVEDTRYAFHLRNAPTLSESFSSSAPGVKPEHKE